MALLFPCLKLSLLASGYIILFGTALPAKNVLFNITSILYPFVFECFKLLAFLHICLGVCHIQEQRAKKRALPSDMHSLGKALARGTLKSVPQAAFQCPSLRIYVEELVGKEVSKECKNLCSLSKPSILCSMSKDAAVKFSWAENTEELKSRAPLFYKVLLTGAGKDVDSASFTNAAAIGLKQRDKAKSLVKYITGLTLKMGKTSKQVI